MSAEHPTYFEMLLRQSTDSRADRFQWKPGDLVRLEKRLAGEAVVIIEPSPFVMPMSNSSTRALAGLGGQENT